MEKPLAAKTALITGSTRGLGQVIAEKLAEAGCHIVLNGLGMPEEIEALRSKIQKTHGTEVFYHPANLTIPAEIANLIQSATERLGSIDILINNAGMQFVAPLEAFPEEKWDAILALNLTAPFHTTKLVLPQMRARKWGRIINIASAHGLVASPYKSAYVASKHGVIGLTKVTALETARDGITCNALCPGFIHTDLIENQIEEHARIMEIPRERVVREIILTKHATKEFVLAEQVAAFVLFLCTEAGASTTGAAISMDGGWTTA